MQDKSTYRHPRTMKEAFGPYTSNQLDDGEYRRPLDKHDKIVLYASLAAALALLGLALCGVIK